MSSLGIEEGDSQHSYDKHIVIHSCIALTQTSESIRLKLIANKTVTEVATHSVVAVLCALVQ